MKQTIIHREAIPSLNPCVQQCRVKLSFCIPTYNRVACLKRLLDSILEQKPGPSQVEICISDNASEDHTSVLVSEYQQRYPAIVYHRFLSNQGFDRNCLKAIDIAHGEYCWLMGSDDIIEPGAIRSVLDRLDQYPNLSGLSVNVKGYTPDLKKEIYVRQLFPLDVPDQLFCGSRQIFSALVTQLGFMSAQIVKKTFWQEVLAKESVEPFCTGYIHVFIIGRIILNHPTWLYLSERCVGFRTENDLTLLRNRYRRLELDLENYEKIAAALLGAGTGEYRRWMSDICKVHIRSAVLGIKFHASASDSAKAFWLCLRYCCFYPAFWLHVAPYFFMPACLLKGLRLINRSTIQRWRLSRLSNQSGGGRLCQ